MIDSFITELASIDVAVPLLGALITGALIGSEREMNRKAAGLRTHMLVCFAAALMTTLGLRMAAWQANLPGEMQMVSDMSRMPHAVLTGVGFLGAGVIFREGGNVQGLTTAATLWVTAALGVVFGTGLWGLATLGTLIVLGVLVVLRLGQKLWKGPVEASLEVTLSPHQGLSQSALIASLAEIGVQAQGISLVSQAEGGGRLHTLRLVGPRAQLTVDAVADHLTHRLGVEQFRLFDVA